MRWGPRSAKTTALCGTNDSAAAWHDEVEMRSSSASNNVRCLASGCLWPSVIPLLVMLPQLGMGR
jgi:hypothetical protein